MDVSTLPTLRDPPMRQLPYPSVAEARAQIAAHNDGALPLEPYQLISQYTLEPLLKSIAQTIPAVTVRYGCTFDSFTQGPTSVTAAVTDADGAVAHIKARYRV